MERLHHSFSFDAAEWPADRCAPAAVLAISPEILSGWFGVEFGAPAHAGGTGRTVAVELPSGRRVLCGGTMPSRSRARCGWSPTAPTIPRRLVTKPCSCSVCRPTM